MKNLLFWILAIIITLAAAIYQRTTGPTYPLDLKVEFAGKTIELELLRSHEGTTDCPVIVPVDTTVEATLFYKRYPTNDEWTAVEMTTGEAGLTGSLPNQPAAGKIAYYIQLRSGSEFLDIRKEEPIVARFKSHVPDIILVPHIFFMFFAMLISTLAGIMAIAKVKSFRIYSFVAFGLLFAGGMILGPLVQKFAFGEYWTGIPFGWDLTDNKTLIAVLFWALAVFMNRKKDARPVYTIVAAIMLLLVYSIPHSMFGSEFNYESGQVIQGFMSNFIL